MALIYIASDFKLKEEVKELQSKLHKVGHMVTIVWWNYDARKHLSSLSDEEFYQEKRTKFIRERDFFGIDKADCLVIRSSLEEEMTLYGASIEAGYAKGKGKPVFIIGKISRCALHSDSTFCNDDEDFIVKIALIE